MERAKGYIGWGIGTAIGVASAGMVLRSMDTLVPRRRKKKKGYKAIRL
jgi:hypothetical protein